RIQPSCQSGQCSRFDAAQKVQPQSFRLAIERIGLDEEPHPDAIEKSIDRSQNETVNHVADQRAEQGGALVGGPVEWRTAYEREDRERAKEPQENPESQAPAHAGTVAAHIALKQDSENCPDQQRYQKVQHDCFGLRRKLRQAFEERQVSTGIFPSAECESADGSCESSGDNCPSPAERGLSDCGAKTSHDSKNYAHGHAETNQVSNKLRESLLCIRQHTRGPSGAHL